MPRGLARMGSESHRWCHFGMLRTPILEFGTLCGRTVTRPGSGRAEQSFNSVMILLRFKQHLQDAQAQVHLAMSSAAATLWQQLCIGQSSTNMLCGTHLEYGCVEAAEAFLRLVADGSLQVLNA